MAQTLFDKIWNDHIVNRSSGFPDTLYIDTHFINKVSSPGAFDTLRERDMPVFRSKQTVVITEPKYHSHILLSGQETFQSDLLDRNCSEFGIEIPKQEGNYDPSSTVLPGQIIACDPEKTDKFGAFGAIAIGINEMQIAQVLATQCILLQKPKTMKIEINGKLGKGLRAKDINDYLISEFSSYGARGYFVEFGGDTILNLDMEGRIAICSMSREIGALGGIIGSDKLTIDYLKGTGSSAESGFDDEQLDCWKTLFSDDTSVFDEVLEFDAEDIRQGTSGSRISYLFKTAESLKKIPESYETAGIIEGNNETDYILSQKDSIEEFERSQAYKTYDGVIHYKGNSQDLSLK